MPSHFQVKKKENLCAVQIIISHLPETKAEEKEKTYLNIIYSGRILFPLDWMITYPVFFWVNPDHPKENLCHVHLSWILIKQKKATPFPRALQTGAVAPCPQLSSFITT